MATITRFVNTDSVGGDGTTNNTTGATAAYASLSAWNTAEAVDLVAAGDEHICECNGSLEDNVNDVALSSWVTGPSSRLTIRMLAGNEHGGVWNTGTYRLVIIQNNLGAITLNLGAEYCSIIGLQLQNDGLGTSAAKGININVGETVLSDIIIRRNIIRTTWVGTPSSSRGIHGNGNAGIVNITIVNNLVEGNWNRSIELGGFSGGTTPTTRIVYNNTCVGAFSNGLWLSQTNAPSIMRIYNNLVDSLTLDYLLSGASTGVSTGSNSTSDPSSPDGVGYQNKIFTFINAGGGDYHLAAGDVGARGLATDLSADPTFPFNNDIDLDTRSAWDVGMDEFVSAGPSLSLPTASSITLIGCTPQVTTDTDNGTLYMVCQLQSVGAPTIAQIKAGLDGNGASAPADESQLVTVTGVQTMSVINTLLDSTDYALYFVQEDAGTNDSNVSTVDWSTVDPAAVLTTPVALNPTSEGVTPQVTSNESGGDLYAYAVVGSSQTPDAATIKANAQSTSTPTVGVNTMPDITGLSVATDYTLAFSSEDLGLNPSAPVYVNFSTTALVANVILRNIVDGSLFINQSNIEYAIWDDAALAGIGAPDAQGTGSTDGNGLMSVSYSASVGVNGMLLARQVVAGVDNTNDFWAAGGVISE